MVSSSPAQKLALRSLALAALIAAAACVWTAPARAASCSSDNVAYPGNDADSPAYANWMAVRAAAARIPSELPVMAGLVESGLRNLNYGDADSVGFFQMRTSIWNTGEYKGYLKNPELQIKWFLDTAANVRAAYIKNGKADPAKSNSDYGVWIADIERPAKQYRGRYQPRLKEAQDLINQTCTNLVGVNVLAPTSSLRIKRRQHPARSGALAVRVSCPNVACITTLSAQFRLPGRRGVLKLSSDVTMLAAGSPTHVKIAVPRTVRSSIRKRLRGRTTTRARLRISVAGTNGAATVRVRKITIAR